MIPRFLEKFRPQIENYKLDTVRILANPLKNNQTLTINQSKFLGLPYVPKGTAYPMGADGTPMIMLAQINFSEIPKLENYPSNGIFQLFVHPTKWYDMSDYQILFHETDNEEHQTEFSFLTKKIYADSPINCEHSLLFKKETEYGGTTDFRFKMTFEGMDYYDFQKKLTKDQEKEMDKIFHPIGHKIGGYAYFTQSDPREYNEKSKDDVLLLQIDTDEEIMFGDSGVANVFINIHELKNKNFEKAYFNWDCC